MRFDLPGTSDAAHIRRLIEQCKPLDVNSTYAYLLLCHHFADTCVIARKNERIVGFVSAYVPPRSPDTVFVWQVAVHPETRGSGLGKKLLRQLLQREALRKIRFIETTVSPSNLPSRGMFLGLARQLDIACKEKMLFDEASFEHESHEAEVLLKLGPIPEGRNKSTRGEL